MQETKKYIGDPVAIHLALPAYVTVLNSAVTPGLRFRGTRDSYNLCVLCFPGWIGATCSLCVEFCFFNFSNAENPGKDLLHPSETTTTEEKRQNTAVPESKAYFLPFKVKHDFQECCSQ